MKVLLLPALVLALYDLSSAHISLTFPPARRPNYDFLDNVRTGGPCGVPATQNGPVTTFQSGSTINISYHLAYPHMGGIRVNLLHSNGTILYALLGVQQWHLDNDSTAFTQEVTLPENFECDRCTLQLLRQAREWVAAGGYIFWSCADITIRNAPDAQCNAGTCSGHGSCQGGKCTCDRLYSGEFCQNKDECAEDKDCSSQGACIDLEGVSLPRKQCFCDASYFGAKCDKVSSLKNATIDETQYSLRRALSNRLTLYARIVGNEIEVALRHNGTGFVGVGWKPRGLNSNCRSSAPGHFPVGTHTLWPNGQTWPLANGAATYYNIVVLNQTGSGGAAEEGGAEEGGVREESSGGGKGEGGQEEGGPEEEGSESIHPMDCADIVIGMARGQRFRLYDYYTRDRSTPQRDSFYGGAESLTAAVGKEEEGFTSLKFRRPLDTGMDPADHKITNSLMVFIWAFGQVFPDYYHSPMSGIEAGTIKNDRFYKPDELKYHGTRNRGATTINFFDVDKGPPTGMSCTGYFNTSCNAQGECAYKAMWTVRGKNVDFEVAARVKLGQWVAIGFSQDKLMPNSDAVVGAVDNTDVFVTDRYITARTPPPMDAQQDITMETATHSNGITTMTFRRPLDSGDANDRPLDKQCLFFLYGWGGGANIATRAIQYHPSTPIVSQERVCLATPTECPDDSTGNSQDSTGSTGTGNSQDSTGSTGSGNSQDSTGSAALTTLSLLPLCLLSLAATLSN